MKQAVFLFLVSLLLLPAGFAASPEGSVIGVPISLADSLLNFLNTAKEDTIEIKTLNKLSRQYINTGRYDEAIQLAQKAQQHAEKLGFKMGLGDAFSNIGVAYCYLGVNDKSRDNHRKALAVRKEINDRQGVAGSYNNIGLVYLNESNYEKTLENYFKSLKIKEEIGDRKGLTSSYNNIGVIYLKQKKYEKALDIFTKSLKICEEIDDKTGIAMANGNIGLVYFGKDNFKKSLESQLKSFKIREKIGDKLGMTLTLANIGNIYINQNDYRMALDIYFQGLKIDKEIGNNHGTAISYGNIGSCYLQMAEFEKSFQYLNKALDLYKQDEDNEGLDNVYWILSDLCSKKGDFKKAFEYQKLYSDTKDTILNEESNKQLTEMNSKYESERKDNDLIKKDAEIMKQQADGEKQIILRNAFILGFILVLVLAFFIFRGYRQKQRANRLLDEKNGKITDSINYAKRIQESILPPLQEMKKFLPESFVLYQPKDIVSGDFYWFHKSAYPAIHLRDGEASKANTNSLSGEDGGGHILIAAVDCTGHGVPGAFMSMMGYNLLEQVVKKHNIYQPSLILNELSKLVVESLRQTDQIGKVNDGMDIALVSLVKNTESSQGEKESQSPLYSHLEYAGAHNSLYLIRNGILHETKADKASIGYSFDKSFSFANHKIMLEKGDCLYIFSDGFADQSGGPDNEKFYYQPFRELLIEISHLSMEEQKKKLQTVFSEWKGSKDQIDDMLVIGLRV